MTDPYTGANWVEDGYVVAMHAQEDAGKLIIALADGKVITRLLDKPETLLSSADVHTGLNILQAGFEGEFYSAGDDGKIIKHEADNFSEFAHIEKANFEQMAVHKAGKIMAVSHGKNLYLFNAAGKLLNSFADHPSTLTGIAFDAKGKRVAVAHYNGVTLWWVNGEGQQKPQRLNWKGSHIGLSWSGNGKFLISIMQDNALHGWRLLDGGDFAMDGYPLKPKIIGWSCDGRWLASSGSAGVVCWDCGGKGPMGRAPMVMGQDCDSPTTYVACHLHLPMLAFGTAKGDVYIARFDDERVVALATKTEGQNSEISFMGWGVSGNYLTAACENGQTYIWPFAE